MRYLVNPKGRVRRAGAKRPTAKQMAARKRFAQLAKSGAFRRRKSRKTATRGRGTIRRGPDGRILGTTKRKGTTMARRKTRKRTVRRAKSRRSGTVKSVRRGGRNVSRAAWRASGFRRNPRRRRSVSRIRARRSRRSYRRNPGMLAQMVRGLKDAGAVTLGKVGFNLINRQVGARIPMPIGGIAGAGITGLLVALGGSFVVNKATSGDLARLLTLGMYQGVLESVLRAANLPVISGALGEYDTPSNSIDSMGVYPTIGSYPTMGNYPTSEDQIETQGAYAM